MNTNYRFSLFFLISNLLALGLLIGSLVIKNFATKKILIIVALFVMILQKIFELRIQKEKRKKIFSALMLAILVFAFGFFLSR
ncbi:MULTISPECIES: hypothetical protein [unclassified Gemella]|uniref:hypothetical protein n=1 Tax=unclassified Gemella TaxID=2624949 RepID=UPI0015D0949B|nr:MULTISPECIES: hypothetical protein [unclassified Gemella]MBF0710372.1 hypothetical protein [Gemella sp. GL1.1]NYS27716.1 hypothetical protein [Gemella sp. GL1]